MIESFVLYKFNENPEYFHSLAQKIKANKTESNIFTDFAGSKISFFNVTVSEDLMLFEVRLEEKLYFMYLTGFKTDKMLILVQTSDEFFNTVDTLEASGVLSYADIMKTEDALENRVYMLDDTSYAYKLGLEFLAEIGAFNLCNQIKCEMEQGNIYATKGVAFMFDKSRLIIDEGKSEEYMAWSIVDQLILAADPGIFPFIWEDLRRAFYDFAFEKDAFSIDNYPELNDMIMKIENSLGKGSNEGHMNFDIVTYKRVIDPGKLDPQHREIIKTKIQKIFNDIAVKEANTYSEYFKEFSILPSSVPGSNARLKFEKFSERILPIARADASGTIVINEKFVDAMTYLYNEDFDRNRGNILYDFYGSEKWTKTLSIFDSIIYSVAIHEIRGHYKFENGRFIFNDDENVAQPQRGLGHIYPNILSMMYFWFAICEFGANLNEDRISLFMEEYPELFELLSRKEKEHLPRDLMKMQDNLFENHFDLNWLTSVTIPEPGIILWHLRRSVKSVTIEELIGKFKESGGGISSREYLMKNLNLLVELGLVEVIPPEAGAAGGEKYRAVPMTTNNYTDIRNILEENIKDPEKLKAKIFSRVLEQGENLWATALISLVKQALRKKTTENKEKLVLIYDNKWVPIGQRSLKVFQQLESKVLKTIEKEGNVEVVRASGSGVVDEILKRSDVPLSNFIVVAEKDIFNKSELEAMLPKDKNDKERLFCVAVDGNKLSDDSYIQLVEIFNMVFKAFIGRDIYTGHPGIEQVPRVVGKYYLLIPRGQELGIKKIRDIYIKQTEFLHYA